LQKILKQIPRLSHPDLLLGYDTSDDAGVFRVRDDLALIQTVDFFTPVVDDPKTFGRIAAANALSDVYAMGGVPVTALNIVGFPSNCLDIDILGEILAGGAEKVGEAGAVILGGHSVEDAEPKYGLAVTGVRKRCRIKVSSTSQSNVRRVRNTSRGEIRAVIMIPARKPAIRAFPIQFRAKKVAVIRAMVSSIFVRGSIR
jgi:selenide,water dikinase